MIALLKVFIAPGAVFAQMREQISILPPLLVLGISVCFFYALQAMFVSTEEYATLNAESAEMSLGLLEMLVEPDRATENSNGNDVWDSYHASMDRHLETMNLPENLQVQKQMYMVLNPLLGLFAVGLTVLLEATYFFVAGNIMQCRRQWSDWIGFTLWTSLPYVIFLVLWTVQTAATGDVLSLGFAAPLSWIPGLGSNPFALTLSISVLWTFWIRVIGMHRWVEKPIEKCLIVVVIVTVLGFLIEAGMLFALVPLE